MPEVIVPDAATLAAANPPPRRGRPPGSGRRVSVGTVSRKAQRKEALESLGGMAQAGLMMAGQLADAATIPRHWPNVAGEIAELAETNEGVAKGIDYLMTVGPYAGILTAALPMVLQIMANHKRVPAAGLAHAGVVPPEALEAEMLASAAKAQADAIAAQQEAEAELARVQAQMMAAQNGNRPE